MINIAQEELIYEDGVKDVDDGENSYEGTEDVEKHLNETDNSIETELATLKARLKEMEDEAEKIRQIQSEVDKQMSITKQSESTLFTNISLEEKLEIDSRSIYVGNVDYGATAEDLEDHFHGTGAVNRVSILCNKFNGQPKGFAYIEFADKDSVQMAMALDESLFRGRQIKVMPKRTNKPGISTTNRPPRGMKPRYRQNFSWNTGYRPIRQPSRGRKSYYNPY